MKVWQTRLLALIIFAAGLGLGYFVYDTEKNESPFAFKLGLDLTGGTHLVYEADTSNLESHEVQGAMQALRDVIERRVNLFGVSEPIVQVERSSIVSGAREERLIVELPGVTDVDEAIRLIGETPLLEFKLQTGGSSLSNLDIEGEVTITDAEGNLIDLGGATYADTGLTGRFLESAQLQFGTGHTGGISNEPIVLLNFNTEGRTLFAELTRENVGEILAIFLDGSVISSPVIREEIPNGSATISGNFTPDEARELVRNLNFGALPVPIELLSTQTIGASLGGEAVERGLQAGAVGFLAVAFFLVLWYRLPGLLAVLALLIFIALMSVIFKLVPVVLTAAGIAGFILSVGMAVDANILIFERLKEELKSGKTTRDAIKEGFARAWLPIRDGNISSILTAVILFWFGTSIVEGFALTFGLGVLVSMLSAITITRIFLYALGRDEHKRIWKMLFGSGLKL
ncbi:MAG: protein translocase subunit SecD [Candidatus Paceibacterota bacterium]